MLDSKYLQSLFARFWKYRTDTFGDADYFDRPASNTRDRPPVFKSLYADRNLLLRPDGSSSEHSEVLQTLPRKKRHRHFGSMRSSQALAQSIFANLKIWKKLGCLLDLKDADGLSLFPIADSDTCSLEHELNCLGETKRGPTSVDVMFIAGYRVAVECKLAEDKFGACSRPDMKCTDPHYTTDYCDGTYTFQMDRPKRCSLSSRGIRYWEFVPQLTNWPADRDQAPCPLRSTYQLLRNLLAACVCPTSIPEFSPSSGHAVVVFDERNPAFKPDGRARCAFTTMKKSLRDPSRLRECSWQQITTAMRADPGLLWLTDSLQAKYGF